MGLKMSERKAITKEVARKYKKTKKGRRSMKNEEWRRKNRRTPSLNPSHQGRETSSPSLPLEGGDKSEGEGIMKDEKRRRKDGEWRKKLFHFSTLGVKMTSSPLKGEDRGEGE